MAQQYWDNGNTRASEQRQGRRDPQRDQGGRYQTSGRFESGIEDTEYASDRESGEDMRGRGGSEQGGYYGSRGNLRDFEDRTSGRGGDFRGSDETRNYDRGGFSAGGRSRDRDYRSQYGGRSGRESGQQNQGFGYGREEQFGAQPYGMDQDDDFSSELGSNYRGTDYFGSSFGGAGYGSSGRGYGSSRGYGASQGGYSSQGSYGYQPGQYGYGSQGSEFPQQSRRGWQGQQ